MKDEHSYRKNVMEDIEGQKNLEVTISMSEYKELLKIKKMFEKSKASKKSV